ncbi:MAG: hypothetical protein F6J98_44740 [Moorea sp. SIO4G2]|uniref:hypothetical protein n=1 Tax=Moorena bouillonii TaxID=207920 RepID=UPI00130135A9|nr:hypothetical protein [Moorena bouillonii]NEO67085.1 hypothetical protein [Moorena sp. SIO4G2]
MDRWGDGEMGRWGGGAVSVVGIFPYCLLPIAYCLLPIAYYLLPITSCLLPLAFP